MLFYPAAQAQDYLMPPKPELVIAISIHAVIDGLYDDSVYQKLLVVF